MTILESFKNGEFAITDSTWDLVDYLHDNDNCLYEEYMVDTTLTHVDVYGECIKSVMHGENSAGLPTMTAQRFLQLVEKEGDEDLLPVKIRILNGNVCPKGDKVFEINELGAFGNLGTNFFVFLNQEGQTPLEKWDNFLDGTCIKYEVIKDLDIESKTLVKQLSKNGFNISLDFESGMIYEIFEVKKESILDLIELLQEAEKEFEVNG